MNGRKQQSERQLYFTLYIFQVCLILFFVFVFDFVKNNHGCLGVIQSLQYKNLSKAVLKDIDIDTEIQTRKEIRAPQYK